MNAAIIILAIILAIPVAIVMLWLTYRELIAFWSAGSYDDRVRSKDCHRATMDDDCVTCTSYTMVGGRVYCSKHKIWGE